MVPNIADEALSIDGRTEEDGGREDDDFGSEDHRTAGTL